MKLAGKLAGRNILLGITGGIAAYKCADLVRLLKKSGAEVRVVMTQAAMEFVSPLTLQTLSGHAVRTEIFDSEQESTMGHIELARWADALLVAPATANFLSQLANGAATDLLTTISLATEAKRIVAPAMNRVMWANEATAKNIRRLEALEIAVWGPATGEQACGETGEGRMLEPQELHDRLIDTFSQGALQGKRVVLTAGPTQEPIDPVRYIGNRSSGKMGFALASAFVAQGAAVDMVCGPVTLPTPPGVRRIDVETAEEMYQQVIKLVPDSDIFTACAAVADYSVEHVASQKLKKNEKTINLQLVRNKDILTSVVGMDKPPFTVGFAAETENLQQHAQDKRRRKGVDVIAANLVGGEQGGFADDQNALLVIWENGQHELPMMSKQRLAHQLVDLITQLL